MPQHRLSTKSTHRFKDFLRNQTGSIAVYTALTMPVLAGMVGFGLDTSMWYAMKRDVQGTADAAAVAAVFTQRNGGSLDDIEAAALSAAVRNGYDDNAESSLSVVEVDVTNGNVTETVRVTVRQRAPLSFAGFFLDQVSVSAIAGAGVVDLGDACVVALDPSVEGAVFFGGTAEADWGCGVQSNSNHPKSIKVVGNADIYDTPLRSVGGIYIEGSLEGNYPVQLFAGAMEDPYADWIQNELPAPPVTCNEDGYLVGVNDVVAFDAGATGGSMRFCNGLQIQGEATFAAGTYYIDGGSFKINSQAVVDATAGVTFVLTGPDADSIADIDINGGAQYELNAPANGDMAGMAIVQDYGAARDGDNKLNGGSTQIINGAIYIPSQPVTFNGGSDFSLSCVRLVARMVKFNGTSALKNDVDKCGEVGVDLAGSDNVQDVTLTR